MVAFDRTDPDFSLTQIRTLEHGQSPFRPYQAFGVLEVCATHNSVVPGCEKLGAVDRVVSHLADPISGAVKVNVDGTVFAPHRRHDGNCIPTSYPQMISNPFSAQRADNAAPLAARADVNAGLGSGYQPLHNLTTPSGGDDRLFGDHVTLDWRLVLD